MKLFYLVIAKCEKLFSLQGEKSVCLYLLDGQTFFYETILCIFLDYARPGVSLFALRPKTQRSAMTGAIALLAKSSIYSSGQ